jgi:2-polyprenyl-3-methyl-5-hydroxy-6-metoxy-1,4-benzoquinol methylase
MAYIDPKSANEQTRDAWNINAAHWDTRMGDDGNDFVETLIWPASKRLLQPQSGQVYLEVACGTGLYARKLAALGAQVVAFDFAKEMIAHARARTTEHNDRIDYSVIDATDEMALLALGTHHFDAAVCQMALFDMAEIDPLLRSLTTLLKPGAPFLFSLMHPCFNNPYSTHVAEMEDREGEIVEVYSMKIRRYMTPGIAQGLGIPGQPRPQLYFHRPLQMILGKMFDAGFVLDALEERAFPPDHPVGRNPLSWSGRFSELPPVLIGRVRMPGSAIKQS